MKLHRLELTGFGPFRERQAVDFDAFERDGVFLISGRTGAGKSSILDGVSFALYGSVPRYENGERRLRSDHSFLGDPTEVRLEFTVGDRRWRVTRAPDYERPAKRGDKLTTEPARAELDELVGDVWVGRAAKPREVALLLDEVLGLNAQQFQQVILLAQNKFSRFLLAKNDERQQLLRTLFGTRRFEQYKDDLEQRRRVAQRELEAAGDQTRTLLDLAEAAATGDAGGDDTAPPSLDVAARRDATARAHQRAAYRVEQTAELQQQADAAHARAAAAHAELVERARTLDDLTAARARLARLDDEAPQMAELARRVQRARAAETLRATLETAERASEALDALRGAAAAADALWIDAGGDTAGDLATIIDDLTGEIARCSDAAEREHELSEAAARAAALDETTSRLAAESSALDEQLARVPAERERIGDELATVSAQGARVDDLRLRRDELREQSAAARDAAVLDDEAAAAEAGYVEASERAERAAASVTNLLRRRFAGRAGELASGLVEGEPCPVCGGTEHPHPAPAADDPVGDDDLAAAEADRDAALQAARDAGDRARRLRLDHAAAVARAAGRSADDLAAVLVEVDEALATAQRSAQRARELVERRTALDELDAAVNAERERLHAAMTDAREQTAVLAATISRLEAELVAARGGFASVDERLAAATSRRDLAVSVREARAAVAERERAATAARVDLDARVAASEFADVDAVRAALVPAAELAGLEKRRSEYDADLAATRARLLELELAAAGTGDERPDLDASAAEVLRADTARATAIAAHRDAVNAADRLGDLLDRIDAAFAAVAEQADATATVTRLADTVAGRAPNTRKMDLETFVLAAELEEIVAAANLRLRDMSSGRYTLHHSDALQARGAASGLSLEVLDAHTGRLRSPQSLSGGETFLASLALALGLAEVVTSRAGGIRLDTLFVDEGFGSLDPETLDLAMRTLDELRSGGRTVGVISHVEGMKEQLAAQIVVEATREGPSIIRQDARSADG
ncbi:SMC family ATPase [Microbacterium sp. NM3R9]|uniref:AAA family ATPase n=1 Tax=Microbacterium thalli TaxID=3027921 RepID=UPI00264AB6C6|nr:SMC family ATPase [Microbacterium thalli]MDN8548254.1 SMC family ATPase [Microbacterium thalli]